MMSNEQLEADLLRDPEVLLAQVTGDGHHYQLTLVSEAFVGLSKIARQQWVYKRLQDHITSGRVHAVNMTTLTKAEWETQRG